MMDLMSPEIISTDFTEVIPNNLELYRALAKQLKLQTHSLLEVPEAALEKLSQKIKQLEAKIEKLHNQTQLDELSGAYRRGFGLHLLTRELEQAHRKSDFKFVVAFIDVDGLKVTNDTYGHLYGDKVIENVGAQILREIRGYDVCLRYGGDEFVVGFLNVTPTKTKEILIKIANQISNSGGSISIGVAEWNGSESLSEVIARADAALYEGRRKFRQ